MKEHTILLVDSEKNILCTYQALLAEDYIVMVARSSHEAREILSKNSIDILITEFYLNGLNTLDFIREVQKNKPDIYIIMLTSASLSSHHYEAIIEAGVQDCFIKPFAINNILVTIKKGLKRSALIKEKEYLQKEIYTIEKFLLNQKPQLCEKHFFLKELRHELERAKRYQSSFSIILFDNDLHKAPADKEWNDLIDHTLLSRIRHTDMITKFNGTYGLLLPETKINGTQHLCKRLHEGVTTLSLQAQDSSDGESNKKLIFISGTYPEESEKIIDIINHLEKNYLKIHFEVSK